MAGLGTWAPPVSPFGRVFTLKSTCHLTKSEKAQLRSKGPVLASREGEGDGERFRAPGTVLTWNSHDGPQTPASPSRTLRPWQGDSALTGPSFPTYNLEKKKKGYAMLGDGKD